MLESSHLEGDVPGDRGKLRSSRVIGTRLPVLPGALRPPTPTERAWVQQMAQTQTRVPKGVFRYASMAEANADWEHWNVELVTAVARGEERKGIFNGRRGRG